MVRAFLTASVVALLAVIGAAEITIHPEVASVLLSFGQAEATFVVMAKGPETEAIVSESSLFTVDSITPTQYNGYTNYTIKLDLEAGVGSDTFTVTVGPDVISGKVIAAGVVIKKDGVTVSGDGAPAIAVGQEGVTTYDVIAVGADGNSADVSGAVISSSSSDGIDYKELDMSVSSLTMTTFTVGITKFRVGTGSFTINIDIPTISIAGESFETSVKVAQQTEPRAKCVAMAGTYTAVGGKVTIPMYNAYDRESIVISIGDSSGSWDEDASTLTKPDQSIVFTFATEGKAKIMCDNEEAYSSGDIMIEVSSSADALAKDHLEVVESEAGKDELTVLIRIPSSDPDEFTLSEARLINKEFCVRVGAASGSCGFVSIIRGSVIMGNKANVPAGTAPTEDEKTRTSIEKCEFQQSISKPCDYLMYESATVKAVGGASIPAATGLATWTIVLIAALGAFALIVLIMLGLLAVYRRSAEQSESDYSSSGPLGVPDPSDLLYEQSIVRDIYGRGDFPDGGPTAANAEEREREADLREEFPRPPSSSGLSRGSATDDASSTYSV